MPPYVAYRSVRIGHLRGRTRAGRTPRALRQATRNAPRSHRRNAPGGGRDDVASIDIASLVDYGNRCAPAGSVRKVVRRACGTPVRQGEYREGRDDRLSESPAGPERIPTGYRHHRLPASIPRRRPRQPAAQRERAGRFILGDRPGRLVPSAAQDAANQQRQTRPRQKERKRSTPVHYSMTWSARSSSDGGIVRPSALAVLRLIVRSYRVGCSTGNSDAFAPRSSLSTWPAPRRR